MQMVARETSSGNLDSVRRAIHAILLGLVTIGFALPITSAIITYTEDFEDDTPPDSPNDDWYTFSSSGVGDARTTVSVTLNQIAFAIQDTSPTVPIQAEFDFGIPAIDADLCLSGSSITFAFRWLQFPTVSTFYSSVVTSTDVEVVGLEVDSSGNAKVSVDGTIGPTFAVLALNTWYNVSLAKISGTCAAAQSIQGRAYITELDASGTVTDASFTSCGDCKGRAFRLHTPGTSNLMHARYDNIMVRNVADPPPTAVGSAATASVVGLNGMSIDPSGTTLIAQLDTGDSVATFSADSLGSPIGSDTVDCGTTQDRVDAIREYVAYVDCIGGDVKTLKIRAPANLASESLPDYCEPGGDNCASTIAIDADEAGCIQSGSQPLAIENVLKDIKSTDFAPIDYSTVTEPESLTDTGSRAFAMAYSTNSGAVGVFGYTSRDDACDQVRLSNRPLPTISSVDDICTWQVQSGSTRTTYIGVADDTIPPRVAIVAFSIDPEGFALTPNVGPFTTFGAFGGAKSLGCAGNKLLFGLDNRAILYDFGTGTVLWDITHTASGLNGVHLSGSGNWALVRTSATHVTVLRADYTALTTNPARVASLEIPTGTYFANFIGFNGANAWIGTTGSPGVIARFPISQQTNATCDQASCIPSQPPPVGGADAFTFGIFTTNPFGEGEGADAAWAFFLIVVASFFGAILFGAIRKKNKRMRLNPGLGAAIFGGLTYAICAVSGLLSGRVLFLSIVFIAGIIALYLWRR